MKTIHHENQTYVSQKKLRRLAARALRVQSKHEGQHPALEAIATTLVPKAQNFIEIYDASRASRSSETVEMKQGRAKVRELHRTMRIWLALTVRDVPRLDNRSFTVSPTVPDDVIAAAQRLVEVIRTHEKQTGEPLAYGQRAIEILEPAIDGAQSEWTEARASLGSGQELNQKVRDAASELQAELVAFRRMLRALLGSSHVDYQTLRTERVQEEEEDEAFGEDVDEDDDDETDVSGEEVAAE